METWIDVVANLGFPVAVAAFVLIRIEPALKKMNDSLILLTAYVKKTGNLDSNDVYYIEDKLNGK